MKKHVTHSAWQICPTSKKVNIRHWKCTYPIHIK